MKNILKKVWEFVKRHKKLFIFLIIICILFIVIQSMAKNQMSTMKDDSYYTATLEAMDLNVEITGSGVIVPQEQYSLTSIVQGDIESAPFEEGDVVQKGDLMYQFSTENAKSNVKSAKLSLKQAKQTYEETKKSVKVSKDNLSLKSSVEGYVNKLYVSEGDEISAGTTIADVYDNTIMYLMVPFNTNDIEDDWIGKKANVYVGDDLTRISGTVKEIAATTKALNGNMVVRNVKIEVKNPGGITDAMTGTATIDGVDCNSEGTFEVKSEGTLVSAGTGTIETLKIATGKYLDKNEIYAVLKDTSVTNQEASAKLQVESAQNTLDSAKKSLDDYSITAPISGTVITKNAKEGDTITTTYAQPLAVIYDLSLLKFSMSVDELDVTSIAVGQEVQVTAGALEGEDMVGHITNISLQSSTNNGVSSYPVTVEMDEPGRLLPGMNVDAIIITQSVKNAQCLPVDSLQRGNVVYVKDTADTKGDVSVQKTKTESDTDSNIPVGFHEVSVEVGIKNDTYVQILSGLTPEDQVYIPRQKMTDAMSLMMGDDGGSSSDEGE